MTGKLKINEIILNKCGFEKYEELLKLPYEDQVFRYYSENFGRGLNISKIVESDDKVYLSNCYYTIYLGSKSLYIKKTSFDGITYNKKGSSTKRAKIWKGAKLGEVNNYHDFFEHMKCEWFTQMPVICLDYITTGMLGNILSKNISNPREFFRYYIKRCIRLDISPELLYQAIKCIADSPEWVDDSDFYEKIIRKYDSKRLIENDGFTASYLYNSFKSKGTFLWWLRVAKNPNIFLSQIINGAEFLHYKDIDDIVRQANVLCKKIDYDWSPARFKEVHKEWTDIIIMKNKDTIPDVDYNYKGLPDLPKNWKLIKNDKELYEEGAIMRHCVYQRSPLVVTGFSFIIHVCYEGEKSVFPMSNNIKAAEYTVEVGHKDLYGIEFKVVDIRGKYNETASNDVYEHVSSIIDKETNKNFFINNYRELSIKDKDKEVDTYVNYNDYA